MFALGLVLHQATWMIPGKSLARRRLMETVEKIVPATAPIVIQAVSTLRLHFKSFSLKDTLTIRLRKRNRICVATGTIQLS